MTLEKIKIREFNQNDFAGLVQLHNVIMPELPTTEKEFRHWDETRDAKYYLYRVVAEIDNEIVAMAEFGHFFNMFHPDKYFGTVQVLPQYRRMGLGSKLYSMIIKKSNQRNAVVIRTEVKEDQVDGLRFAKKNGFVAEIEEWEARADPREFDFKKYDGLFDKLQVKGIEIVNLEDMLEHDQDAKQELYKLAQILAKDVPQPEAYTPTDFELWEKKIFRAPNLLAKAFLVAKKDGDYIALHSLWGSEADPKTLIIGMTSVKRKWRNQGIAKALKVANTKWAFEHGYEQIITWNNSENVEILKINNEFGFVRQPAWIGFKKEL